VAFGGYNGKYHNAVSVYKLPGYQQHVRSPVKQQQQQQQQAKPTTPKQQQQAQQDQQLLQQQAAEQEEQQHLEQQQQLEAQEAAIAAAGNGSGPLQNGGVAMVSSSGWLFSHSHVGCLFVLAAH
jgi:membrane protein involved in colicin uptake